MSDQGAVISAVTAGAWLAGVSVPPAEGVPRALGWLRIRWGAGDEHLPFTLVHDLGHLLLLGGEVRLASSAHLAAWPDEERAARLAYEDGVLSHWLMDPILARAHDAIAALPVPWRDEAVAHALGLALSGPLAALELPLGNVAHLRNHEAPLVADLPKDFEGWTIPEAARRPDPGWVEFTASVVARCAEALAGRGILSEPDLWEIAHLPALPDDAARLALRQLHRAADRVGLAEPAVAGRVRRRAQEIPVENDAADEFPAGGFDAISPRGRLENLVRSEMGYAGEAVEIPGGQVDLFDLRFFQSELLYYTRDESPLLDARRSYTLIFDRPGALQHKAPGLWAQTLTMVQGLALALIRDLSDPRMLGPQGVRFDWVWAGSDEADLAAIEAERGLLGLSLAAEVAHRRVQLDAVGDLEDERLGRGRWLVFSPLPPPRGARHLWVQVGGREWLLEGEALAVDTAEAIRAVADRLLTALIEGRR